MKLRNSVLCLTGLRLLDTDRQTIRSMALQRDCPSNPRSKDVILPLFDATACAPL